MEINKFAEEVHQLARDNGWWDNFRDVPELLCLIHSEVSEALEHWRRKDDEKIAEELADIVIRTFDMANSMGIDIEEVLRAKHEKNKKRPYRHGGKRG